MRIIIDPPILAVIYRISTEIFRISQKIQRRFQDFNGDFTDITKDFTEISAFRFKRDFRQSVLDFCMWRTPRGHVFSRDRTLDTETKAYARRLADSVDRSSVEQRCTAYSSVYQLEQGSERERTKTVSCCWPWSLCPDPTPTREKGSGRFRAIWVRLQIRFRGVRA